jgi:hypothetical protein
MVVLNRSLLNTECMIISQTPMGSAKVAWVHLFQNKMQIV